MRHRSVRRDSIALLAAALLAVAGCAPAPQRPASDRVSPEHSVGPSARSPAGATPPPAAATAGPAPTAASKPPASAGSTASAASAQAPSAARPAGGTESAGPGAAGTHPANPLAPGLLPGWSDDDLAGLADALRGQCALRPVPSGWTTLCAEIPASAASLRRWIEKRFLALPLRDGGSGVDGLITGYHEPELRGSRTHARPGQVPLYRRPPESVLKERPTRAEIETSGALAGSELAWIDDPVEAFFLQVQGSGRIRLDDGSVMRVGYAGDNGRPYRAIGATLVERGALAPAQVNAGAIKAWLRAHPSQADAVMRSNPRYVFFRELPAREGGPPGALGVPLTPMRSVAVDPKQVPAGALLWLDTTDPIDGRPIRRLVVAQDTGAAIVGAVRADLFWGTGERAEQAAGLMKSRGRLWKLEPAR